MNERSDVRGSENVADRLEKFADGIATFYEHKQYPYHTDAENLRALAAEVRELEKLSVGRGILLDARGKRIAELEAALRGEYVEDAPCPLCGCPDGLPSAALEGGSDE